MEPETRKVLAIMQMPAECVVACYCADCTVRVQGDHRGGTKPADETQPWIKFDELDVENVERHKRCAECGNYIHDDKRREELEGKVQFRCGYVVGWGAAADALDLEKAGDTRAIRGHMRLLRKWKSDHPDDGKPPPAFR